MDSDANGRRLRPRQRTPSVSRLFSFQDSPVETIGRARACSPLEGRGCEWKPGCWSWHPGTRCTVPI